jgi:uncharacterized SAM-binding protein YcdF (DUF218 family)
VPTPRSGASRAGPPAGLVVCRGLGLLALALAGAVTLTPLPNWLARRSAAPARLGPADAIVVLGGAMASKTQLGAASLYRLVEGVRLHRLGLAPTLVLLGLPGDEGQSEQAARSRLARDLGVPAGAIVLPAIALTTREEAAQAAAVLGPLGARRVLLVTDSLHLVRAARLFTAHGFEVLGAPADEIPSGVTTPEGRLHLTRKLAQELLARLYYRAGGNP